MEGDKKHHISASKVGIAYYSYQLHDSIIVTDASNGEYLLEVMGDEVKHLVPWIDVHVLAEISAIASERAKEQTWLDN